MIENYRVTLPDQTVVYVDLKEEKNKFFGPNYKNAAEEALRKSNIRTSWKDPQEVSVKVEQLKLIQGEIKVAFSTTIKVMPYKEEMTDEELNNLVQEELKGIPKSFHKLVSNMMYEHVHRESNQNKWIFAENLISELKSAINGMETCCELRG